MVAVFSENHIMSRQGCLCFVEALTDVLFHFFIREGSNEQSARRWARKAVMEFIQEHGGQRWNVPSLEAAERPMRNEMIYLEYDGTHACAVKLGRKHHISSDYVKRIAAQEYRNRDNKKTD